MVNFFIFHYSRFAEDMLIKKQRPKYRRLRHEIRIIIETERWKLRFSESLHTQRRSKNNLDRPVTGFYDITCQVRNAGIPLQKFLPKTVGVFALKVAFMIGCPIRISRNTKKKEINFKNANKNLLNLA